MTTRGAWRPLPEGLRRHEGGQKLYALNLPADFEPVTAVLVPQFDQFFEMRGEPIWVAVVVDATPHDLELLDEVVERNVEQTRVDVRGLRVFQARLGGPKGIAAHRSELRLVLDASPPLLMLNTHGATDTHSFQVVVWGAKDQAVQLRALMANMESGLAFDFGRPVTALTGTARPGTTSG